MRGYLIVGGTAVVAALWYIAHCAWYPFAACLWCGGKARVRSSCGRSWRRCRACKGTGERVRVGRRVYDWVVGRRRG